MRPRQPATSPIRIKMSVTWLHISDFHIRAGDPYDRDVVLRALVASVRDHRERGKTPNLIFATGDIAYSGKSIEYEIATTFFDALLGAAGLDRRSLFVIPGNHDVDRDLGVGLARTLESREQADAYFAPHVPKPHLSQKLGAFIAWYNEYFTDVRSFPTNSTCGPVEIVELSGCRIGIVPLNSALFCQGDDDHDKLFVGRRCLDVLQDTPASVDLWIALIHHPLEWLSSIEGSNVRATLQKHIDVILSGHLHKTDVTSIVGVGGRAVHISAGAAYQSRKWPNRAIYTALDGSELVLYPIQYQDDPQEVWTLDPSVFPNQHAYEGRIGLPRFVASEQPRAGIERVGRESTAQSRFRHNIPSRGDRPFVGREQTLGEILQQMGDVSRDQVVVLHGLPGVGKSEIAREFGRRHRARYPGGTFFINAGGGTELVDLARIGANILSLDFPPDLSLRDQCERTLAFLGTAPVMLIYDNAHSIESVQPFLPPAGMPCHVLITSLSDRWPLEVKSVYVPPLSIPESLELIRCVGGLDVADRYGHALVELGGGLPVQLFPAAATLAYEARRGRLQSVSLVITREAQESFRLVYERLDASVRLVLYAAAFLNGQRIPREILLSDLILATGWSEAECDRRADVCLDLHLLEGSTEFRMHQLFSAYVLNTARKENPGVIAKIRQKQWDSLLKVANEVRLHPANHELVATMLVYPIQIETWMVEKIAISVSSAVMVGRSLLAIGKYNYALSWLRFAADAVESAETEHSLDHEFASAIFHAIGICLSETGQFAEARRWFEGAVDAAKKGNNDGRVNNDSLGRSLHQVGIALTSVGMFEAARSWFEEAIVATEQGDPSGKVDQAGLGISLYGLGFCIFSMGQITDARFWFERAVEAIKHGDTNGHIDQLSLGKALHQVGLCYSRAGEYNEALPWYKLAVQAKECGDPHRRIDWESLSRSLHEIGVCLAELKQFGEARMWFERSAQASEHGDIYGRIDYDSVGASFHLVALCLAQEDMYAEAASWYRRAIEMKEKGDVHARVDHENLSNSLVDLGYCCFKLGRDNEAKLCLHQAVAAARTGNRYGRVDPASLGDTLSAAALLLRDLGEVDLARTWEQDAHALSILESDADLVASPDPPPLPS